MWYFQLRRILILVFLGAFHYDLGVSGGWWFAEMSALFFAVALIIIFLSGLSEKEAVNTFLEGAADLILVLIIGILFINIVMDNGMISDTLLYYTSSIIENMNSGSLQQFKWCYLVY